MTTARGAWAIFATGAGLLAAALAMISRETLRLDLRERFSRKRAAEEGRIREALWRMDTAMAGVLAVESARSPRVGGDPEPVPPADLPPFALLRFLAARTGDVPGAALPAPLRAWESEIFGTQPLPGPAPPPAPPAPAENDYSQRASRNFAAQQQAVTTNGMVIRDGDTAAGGFGAVRVGAFEPRWIHDPAGPAPSSELFFVRTVVDATGCEFRQGIRVDWPRLREWLLAEARDLLPGASLIPAPFPDPAPSRMLASIPAGLDPGPRPDAPLRRRWTPALTALVLAWGAVAAAAVLAGLALRGALELGERRARFASAVTHELRTPLTTFRLYSQMLASGMAPPGAEKEYLSTLQSESERLSRVVESVLLYSRLEEGRGGAHRERIGAADLLDRVLPALEKRAAEGGLARSFGRDLPADARVDVEIQAVEQILLNLVDNACKYAAAGKRIDLLARVEGRRLLVTVADSGPGIPAGEAKGIFEPFRRLARDEAGAAPGAGLGLAVARGLARALGGDLVLVDRPGTGAAFRLSLPLAS